MGTHVLSGCYRKMQDRSKIPEAIRRLYPFDDKFPCYESEDGYMAVGRVSMQQRIPVTDDPDEKNMRVVLEAHCREIPTMEKIGWCDEGLRVGGTAGKWVLIKLKEEALPTGISGKGLQYPPTKWDIKDALKNLYD